MKKHTPGPWKYRADGSGEVLIDKHRIVRHSSADGAMSRYTNTDQMAEEDANARLIAAAPEMLEALELVRRCMANLMAKGNIDWGKTFDIDFGLMNEMLIKTARAEQKAKGDE